jgi:hypothetical protein
MRVPVRLSSALGRCLRERGAEVAVHLPGLR